MPSVYMQAILWKFGQIYVSNIYCDASSLGFNISVTIANNMIQITFCKPHFTEVCKMFHLEPYFWEVTRVILLKPIFEL